MTSKNKPASANSGERIGLTVSGLRMKEYIPIPSQRSWKGILAERGHGEDGPASKESFISMGAANSMAG